MDERPTKYNNPITLVAMDKQYPFDGKIDDNINAKWQPACSERIDCQFFFISFLTFQMFFYLSFLFLFAPKQSYSESPNVTGSVDKCIVVLVPTFKTCFRCVLSPFLVWYGEVGSWDRIKVPNFFECQI